MRKTVTTYTCDAPRCTKTFEQKDVDKMSRGRVVMLKSGPGRPKEHLVEACSPDHFAAAVKVVVS